MENPEKSLNYLQEVEKLAEEILTDRQEIVALDGRRQQAREGLRALSKSEQDKTWIAIGPTLIKVPTEKATGFLQKDYNQVDQEINILRSNLKEKVNKLRDLEYQPPVPGLMLKALDQKEMAAVGQVLGRHVD